nr:EOG090X0EI4 [Ceriodaphnia reticulata]
MLLRRLFHHTPLVSIHATEVVTSSQSVLSTLRKKTGFAIANCKKALEINNNDIGKAESWLISQAQTQGWAKAAKLQNRSTPNGLIGVAFDNKSAVMVEVNCETDFVAKNEKFQLLVAQATEVCFRNAVAIPQKNDLLEIEFSSEQLGALQANVNSKLSDLLALNIGQIGENILLRRGAALCSTKNTLKFSCSTHPQNLLGGAVLGKYAAVFAYEESKPSSELAELTEIINIENLPKQLCQHIIGMNPSTIEKTETSSGEEETALYHQEFLACPEYTVKEVLAHVGWQIKGFLRYECGESLN